MKDNTTISAQERKHEREVEQHEREDARRARERSNHRRPVAARMTQRVAGIRRQSGLGRGLKKISRTHPVKAPVEGASAKEFARRSVARVRWVNSKKLGQWASHGKYLERDGAQEEGKRGVGFSATEDAVDLASMANHWQSEGDARVYKLMISPEDGNRLDLVAHTRAVMRRVEQHVGKPLEWGGIDHHNTANAHVHVLLRGRGIELSQELVSRGIREISADEATQSLGYKSAKEKRAELDHDIHARRFTQLDRLIEKKVVQREDGVQFVSETGLSRFTRGRASERQQVEVELRTKRIARLQSLETLGVAEKVGSMTWRLDSGWQTALKQLEVLRTRSTMLVQQRELLTDPRVLPTVSKLQPGDSLVGRALGGGVDELTDRPYILVEGMDGRAHFVSRSDDAQVIKPGTLVALEGYVSKSGHPGMKVIEYDLQIPARGFASVMAGNAEVRRAADDECKRREQTGRAVPEVVSPKTGFAAQMQRMLQDQSRARALARDKKKSRSNPGIGLEIEK